MIARGHKRQNYIPSLLDSSHTITDHTAMEVVLHNHFSSVFGTAPEGGDTINFQALDIQPMGLVDQEAPVSADEI